MMMDNQGPAEATEIKDQEARLAAITTDCHAFVWASAGTGKTHTLALRALYLLLKWAPEELYLSEDRMQRLRAASTIIHSIVLTTFTRKAAAEMQVRLYRYLDLISNTASICDLESSPEIEKDPLLVMIVQDVLTGVPSGRFELLKRGAEALAERAGELQVSTLHSFAAGILRRHPLECGIPSGTRFAEEDEDDVSDIEEEVVNRWWLTEAWDNTEIQSDLIEVMKTAPIGDINSWMVTAYRQPWITDHLESAARVEPADQRGAVAALEALAGVMPSTSKALRIADQLRMIVQRLKAGDSAAWLPLSQLVRGERNYLFLSGSKIPKGLAQSIQSLSPNHLTFLESYQSLYAIALGSTLGGILSAAWESWVRLLRNFASWSQYASIRLLGLVGFDDMIQLAVAMLRDHTDVRRAESLRLRALLVDEFQDTDPLQLELIERILKRPEGSDHEILGFFVGDLKQSIYRFRGTDVPSIRRFEEEFQSRSGCRMPVRKFQLRTTFRSTQPICSFVNGFFDEPVDLAVEEERLVPFRTSNSPKPQWITVDPPSATGKPTVEQLRGALADCTVNLIEGYLRSKDPSNPPYKDILVLTRKGLELEALLPAMQERGLPILSTGTQTFYRHHEVLDVLNLLISLHNPLDSVAVAAVLRSPIIGLNDDEIHRLISILKPCRILFSEDSIPAFLPPFAIQRIETLRILAGSKNDRMLADWLQEVSLLIPQASYTPKSDVEGRTAARIDKVFGDFEKVYAQGMIAPLAWLLKQRERASRADSWDAALGEDVSIFDESIDAIRIMTVHKAKGLEARFVILYGWTPILSDALGPSRRTEPGILAVTGTKGKSCRAVSMKWGPVHIETPAYEEAVSLALHQEMEEARRLAYVAATRARDQLAILTPSPAQLPERISLYLQTELERGDDALLDVSPYRPREYPLRARHFPSLDLDPSRYQNIWLSRYSALNETEATGFRRPTDETPPSAVTPRILTRPQSTTTEFPLQVGRLTHTYLERHAEESHLDESTLLTLASLLNEGAAQSAVIDRVRNILQAFFDGRSVDENAQAYSERIRTGRILGREVPFYTFLEEQPWHGVIDLILEEGSSIVAVDYKTGAKPKAVPASYQTQEWVYVSALRQLFPDREIQFEFWWLEQSLHANRTQAGSDEQIPPDD